MRVIFFGRLAEQIDRSVEIELAGPTASVGEVRALLADRFPHARDDLLRNRLRACVDDGLVDDSFRVRTDGLLEFLPPVSGG